MKKIELSIVLVAFFSVLMLLPALLSASIDSLRFAPLNEEVMKKVFPKARLVWEKKIEGKVYDATLVGNGMDAVVAVRRKDAWIVEYLHNTKGILWRQEVADYVIDMTPFDEGRKVGVVYSLGDSRYETLVLRSMDGAILWRKGGWYVPSPSGKYFFGRGVLGTGDINLHDSTGTHLWEGKELGFPERVHGQMAFLPGNQLVAVFCSEGKAEIALIDVPGKTVLWRKPIPTSWQVWCDLLYLSTSASGDRIVFDLSVNGPNYSRGEHPIVCFSKDGVTTISTLHLEGE